jgi:hypothetical protein
VNNEAAATELDDVMVLNNDLDGIYCTQTGDGWIHNGVQLESNGLGGGSFAGIVTTVNTSPTGNTVTWVAGSGPNEQFEYVQPGMDININGTRYVVATVNHTTNQSLTLTTSPGTQSGVPATTYTTVNVSGTSVTWLSGPKWSTDSSLAYRDVQFVNGPGWYTTTSRNAVSSSAPASTTTMTLAASAGTLTSAILWMGHGLELAGCAGFRAQDGDIGGNQIDGIKMAGTFPNQSSENLITANQIGKFKAGIRLHYPRGITVPSTSTS